MDKKLNFTELCNFYAKAAGIPVAEAESFVHAFFDVIVEGLEKDSSVKINGLGTFKVVEVESRSSVNINTGERFEIDGHKRLTFVPADSLKDIINAPFAMFEPVEVDDDIDDDDEDEKEEVTPVEEVAQVEQPVAETVAVEEVAVEEVSEELPVVEVVAVEEAVTEEVVTDEQPTVNEEVPVAPSILNVEIEEEMPGETTEEDVRSALCVEIEEEMPVEVSDYIPEQSVAVEAEVAAEQTEETVNEYVPKVEEDVLDNHDDEQLNETSEEIVEPVIEEPAVVAEPEENTVPIVEEKKLYFDTLPREKKRKKHPWVAIFAFLILLFIGVAFAGIYYFRDAFSFDWSKWSLASTENVDAPAEVIPADTLSVVSDTIVTAVDSLEVVPVDSLAVQPVDSIVAVEDTVAQNESETEPVQPVTEVVKKSEGEERFKIVESLAMRELSTIFVADTTDYKIVGTMCSHTVMSEETLIRISLKYYGDKRLWPYIVKYNNMVRPNDLACDMVLKIPRLIPRK